MRIMEFPFHIQLTPFSCSAAVYQTVVRALTGSPVGHWQAMHEIGTTMFSGTSDYEFMAACNRRGLAVKDLGCRVDEWDDVLKAGGIVVTCDNVNYRRSHCIAVVGYTNGNKWVVADPLRVFRLVTPSDLVRQATDAFAVKVG